MPTVTRVQQPATRIAPATATPVPYTLFAGMHDGLPQGLTLDGFPFLGQPDAPITVIEYSDYQ